MKLLYPQFLWALLAVIIPIIIHLFNFKKFKKVYFSDITLLKDVKLETQSRSKLKHWLVLLTRILAIICIVIAFCQPYFNNTVALKKSGNVVSVYLDNSQSMDTKVGESYIFDEAKSTALNLVNNYSATDNFQLLTNDFEGKHQRIVSQREVLKLIEEVKLSPLSKDFNEIYERQKELTKLSSENKIIYWLSDFQENNFSINQLSIDSSINLNLIPFEQSGLTNLYIDSVWFESPNRQINQDEALKVRVVNQSDKELGVKVNLNINKKAKGILNTVIEANTSKVVTLNYSVQNKGAQFGKVYLSDYPNADLTFDDEFLFSYTINEAANVLYLTSSNKSKPSNVAAVFKDDDSFKLKIENLSSLDYATLGSYNLIIIEHLAQLTNGLQNELNQCLNKGGSLLLIPSKDIDLGSYQSFMSKIGKGNLSAFQKGQFKVGGLNESHYLYNNVFDKIPKNIDLPYTNGYYNAVFSPSVSPNILLKLTNSNPFLSQVKVGEGLFYFLASPLESTTFSEHALFVPTLLRIAENSGAQFPLAYEIGAKGFVKLPQVNTQETIKIKSQDEELTFIPELIKNNLGVSINVHENIKAANHYEILLNEVKSMPLTYNFSRNESSMSYYSKEVLEEQILSLQLERFIRVIDQPKEANNGSLENLVSNQKYWRHFILLALFLLFVEVVLIRYLKG